MVLEPNELWAKLFPWRTGDRVKIINTRSAFYGRIGTVKDILHTVGTNKYAVKFGIYIKFGNNYEFFYDKELERVSNDE